MPEKLIEHNSCHLVNSWFVLLTNKKKNLISREERNKKKLNFDCSNLVCKKNKNKIHSFLLAVDYIFKS
jgi:hypothetical protein